MIILSMDNFPEWLDKHMQARGINQAELSQRSGLSTGTVSNLLNDLRNPGPEVCRALASALHLPQRDVFIAAGLLEDEQITELSPKMQHIVDLLGQVDDAVLELVSDQIELVLIPHGQKVIGSKHAKAK